jgi:DNA polymerase
MLVGEAPGAREDECGRPFVGMSGDFLDDLLANVGIDRQGIYITSVIKCRPPENRDPRQDELETCIPAWLHDQIEIIDPQIIVVLGGVAFRALFDERTPLKDVHGEVRERDGRRWMITYHPASGMRFPDPNERIYEDFRTLAEMLQ